MAINSDIWGQRVVRLKSIEEIIQSKKNGVVVIDTYRGTKRIKKGTGFFISKDGLLLTNHHVVDDFYEGLSNTYIRIRGPNGEDYEGVELGGCLDKYRIDLCVMRVKKRSPKTWFHLDRLPIGRGHSVFTLGHCGKEWSLKKSKIIEISRSHGLFKEVRLHSKIYNLKARLIVTDLQICPGDSGGPVFDRSGNILGINSGGIIRNEWKRVKPITIGVEEILNFLKQKKAKNFRPLPYIAEKFRRDYRPRKAIPTIQSTDF